jgi:foldase protein PrsA
MKTRLLLRLQAPSAKLPARGRKTAHLRWAWPLLLLLLAGLAAGCGGGGSGSVPADAIAKVGSTPISKSDFNELIKVGIARDQVQGQAVPKPGTPAYTQLKDSAVSYLVSEAELQQEAQKLGVTVTKKQIDTRLALIKKTYYGGSEKKLQAALKADHINVSDLVQFNIQPQLLSENLYNKVTSSVKVSQGDAKRYYEQNKASYTTTSPSRSVRHILVHTRKLADTLETKLKNGASFADLAKKYSTDSGSAKLGGKLTAVKGQLVPPFQRVAFSLKTGQISQPVHTAYGWHIIQALGPVRSKYTQPFSQVEATIRTNLATQKKQPVWTTWLAKVKADFNGKVAYQTGYTPATTSIPTTPPTTTG